METNGLWMLLLMGVLYGWGWLLIPRAWISVEVAKVMLRAALLCALMFIVGVRLISQAEFDALAAVLFVLWAGQVAAPGPVAARPLRRR